MSYVQGTKIKVVGEFRDPTTKALEDPTDVRVSVFPPGLPTIVHEWQAATGVSRLGIGRFQAVIDTAPAAGEWEYLFEGTGTDAVVKRRDIRVRPRPTVVV